MPLVSSVLKSEFEKFFDQDAPTFEGFPETILDVSTKWSQAFNVYASQVIPVSVNSVLAQQAMALVLLTIDINSQNADQVLKDAFQAYAIQLALGMQPAFTAAPPAVPLVLDSVYAIGLSGGSNGDCLNELVSLVDTWMKTGTAVNNVSGATINWS